MACIEQKTDFNFLNWHKVVGSYTLAQLQASGVPVVCDNITEVEGWNILTLSFLREVDLSAQVDSQQGITFNSDGTKMFIADGGTSGATDSVHEYSLSSAWNISTKSFVQSKNIAADDGDLTDVRFGNNGLKMYGLGRSAKEINGYDLSIAYDISTAVHDPLDVLSISTKDSTPIGLTFKTDGTGFYFLGNQNDKIYQYSLSVAWDITSASFVNEYALPSTVGLNGLFLKPDGTRIYYISSFADDFVYELVLSTAYDITTATAGNDFDLSSKTSEPRGLYFRSDGLKMYFVDQNSDKCFEYDLTD